MKKPKFTIKTLIIMMAFLALAFGWWVDRLRLTHQVQEVKQQMQAMEADHEAVQRREPWLLPLPRLSGPVQHDRRKPTQPQ